MPALSTADTEIGSGTAGRGGTRATAAVDAAAEAEEAAAMAAEATALGEPAAQRDARVAILAEQRRATTGEQLQREQAQAQTQHIPSPRTDTQLVAIHGHGAVALRSPHALASPAIDVRSA